ncbi:MAG: hypothetical protein ABI476_09675 [Oxalobacteraceae bacterium]
MLHERKLPQSEAEDLAIIYAVKLRLLGWLLKTPPAGQVTKDELIDLMGEPIGLWFWTRIRKPETRTAFGNAVDALGVMARADLATAVLVADAIEHDATFDNQWSVAGYELRFPRLYPAWLDAVKLVAEPFYDLWLSGSGFAKAEFGLQGEDMTRDRIMKAFRPPSFRICGYCDGPLGDVGTTVEANDCDHFFPKSKWPHLAIHPVNLFAACKGCNECWKLDKTPMGEADVLGLSETYHPQLRPGVAFITVNAIQSLATPRNVRLLISDAHVRKRARTLNTALDLEARWTNSVNEQIDGRGVSVFVAKSVRDSRRNQTLSQADLLEIIDSDIDWHRQERGKLERSFQLEAALRYQKTNHLADILAELSLASLNFPDFNTAKRGL